MAISGSDSGLQAFLRAVRKPRDEAQLTQVIAAAAKLDETFSADLVRLFLNAAPNRDAAHLLGEPPAALRCRAEVQVYDAAGSDRGRADLVFDDEGSSFSLLAELKLASDYGETQLGRYSDAVDAFSQPRRGLIAATTLTPQTGEEAVAGHPRWLGSIRWFRVVDAMRELEHRDRLVKRTWVAWLDLLRTEGDFGPMDFDPRDVEGWARRDAAETFLFSALNELARPTESLLREATAASPADDRAARLMARGKHSTSVVIPWKNQPNVQYAVPADLSEHRFRIQFLAYRGEPYFTAEARYEHPKETLGDDPAIAEATAFLRDHGFSHGSDGYGYYWARVVPASEWLYQGAETPERLLALVREAVLLLAKSRIFDALNARSARTPAERGPADEL